MAEELSRKKKVRGGHKASASRMMSKVDELMVADGVPDISKVNQLGMSLKEKLQEIKVFKGEILALVKDDELDDEIAQADLFKERHTYPHREGKYSLSNPVHHAYVRCGIYCPSTQL